MTIILDSEEKLNNYISENNIEQWNRMGLLVGYNKVLIEIKLKDSDNKYYMIETFNKDRFIIRDDLLTGMLIQSLDCKTAILANMAINCESKYRYSLVKKQYEIVDKENKSYKPTDLGIRLYLSFIDKTNKDKYKTIKIVELKNNLSKEEFDKLLSQEDKYLLVDRNTIIDRDTSSKVKVYTRQSGILHVDSAESVFEKPICIRK